MTQNQKSSVNCYHINFKTRILFYIIYNIFNILYIFLTNGIWLDRSKGVNSSIFLIYNIFSNFLIYKIFKIIQVIKF
jgi:hypothetical protein